MVSVKNDETDEGFERKQISLGCRAPIEAHIDENVVGAVMIGGESFHYCILPDLVNLIH